MKPSYCWKTGRSSRNPRRPSKFFAAFLGYGPGCMPSSSFLGLFEIWSTVSSPGIAISGWASRTRAVCRLRKNEPGLFRKSCLLSTTSAPTEATLHPLLFCSTNGISKTSHHGLAEGLQILQQAYLEHVDL